MAIRVDRRTPNPPDVECEGIPYKDSYTYLGVEMDNTGDMRSHISKFNQKLRTFKA